MIAALLVALAGAAAPVEPDALPAEERRSTRIIRQCEDLDCRWQREDLGRAFLVRAAAAAVLRGEVDETAAANARLLVPDQADSWQGLLASDGKARPDEWVQDWLTVRELAHGDGEFPSGLYPADTGVDLLANEPAPQDEFDPEVDPSELVLDHLATPPPPKGMPETLHHSGFEPGTQCEVQTPLGMRTVRVVGRTVYRRKGMSQDWVAAAAIRGRRYMVYDDERIETRVGGPEFSFKAGMFGIRRSGQVRENGRVKIGIPLLGHRYRASKGCSNSQAALGAITIWSRQQAADGLNWTRFGSSPYSAPAYVPPPRPPVY